MQRILIVDDEPAVLDVAAFALKQAGFVVQTAETLEAARDRLAAEPVDLLVLDLGLPDGDGMDLCRRLRRDSGLPVLILTSRDGEVDRVLGLEAGADDYVVKPFLPRELVARVRAILRRTSSDKSAASSTVVQRGPLRIDPEQHSASWRGTAIPLTRVELTLLYVLCRAPGRVFSRDDLIQRIYRGESVVSDRTVDSHVKGVRRKFAVVDLSADPIETVHGVGYRARDLQ